MVGGKRHRGEVRRPGHCANLPKRPLFAGFRTFPQTDRESRKRWSGTPADEALKELDKKGISEGLDSERKAAMISNLLVVLVSDHEVTPIINTGTLYS